MICTYVHWVSSAVTQRLQVWEGYQHAHTRRRATALDLLFSLQMRRPAAQKKSDYWLQLSNRWSLQNQWWTVIGQWTTEANNNKHRSNYMLQSVSFSMKEVRGRLKFLLLDMLKIRLDKVLWIILSNLEVQHTFEMSNFEGGRPSPHS